LFIEQDIDQLNGSRVANSRSNQSYEFAQRLIELRARNYDHVFQRHFVRNDHFNGRDAPLALLALFSSSSERPLAFAAGSCLETSGIGSAIWTGDGQLDLDGRSTI